MIANVNLNDGNQIPQIGLGTYLLRGGVGYQHILSAIKDGYRSLDTATNYDNEGAVGKAIRDSGVPRNQLFVSSKLPGKYHHYDDALSSIKESLFRMGLNYFDLFLIHWPLPKRGLYVEAWQAFITAQKLGLIKSVGVSNFEPEHLDNIIKTTGVTPAVNQIEIHPYWINEKNVQFDKKQNIVTEAWSPLGHGNSVLGEPVIKNLAEKYHKNTGQIIIRWHLQRGIIPLPKSANIKHQRTNLNVYDFQLTNKEIEQINSLTKPNGRTANQDPNEYEEFE